MKAKAKQPPCCRHCGDPLPKGGECLRLTCYVLEQRHAQRGAAR
jgi:hypothetical protein